jgi:heptosyltransferase-3
MSATLAEPLRTVAAFRPSPRVTFVRAGGLGDTLLALPALNLLRDLLPAAELTLVGSSWAEAILPLIPFPLTLVRFDSSRLAPLFVPGPPADPSNAFAAADAAIVCAPSRDDVLARNAARFCAGPVVTWPATPAPGVHAAVHFARAVVDGALEEADVPIVELRVPEETRTWALRWLEERLGRGARPAAVHPGSGGARKRWPAGHVARAMARLQRPVILLEGPADAEACRQVRAALPQDVTAVPAVGLSVSQAAAVLEACVLYIGNDSGMSHLAAAIGVPTIAVFGPTDPSVWAPRGRHATALRPAPGAGWPEPEEVLAAAEQFRNDR